MQKKTDTMFCILEKISFQLILSKTQFYRERILVIGSQHVIKQVQDLRYYYERIFQTEVIAKGLKYMTKLLSCRFGQCFGPFNMLTVNKCCDTELFRHLINDTFCNQ